MKNQNNLNNIKENVLNKIKEQNIKKRPTWYFMIRSIFVSAFIFMSVFFVVYFSSFMQLLSYEQEFKKASRLGTQGFFILMQTIPWMIIVFLLIALTALHFLVRYFEFGYQRPILYTMLGTLLATFLLSYLIGYLDKESRLARLGENRKIPFLNNFHDKYRDGRQGRLLHGIIIEKKDNYIIVQASRSSSTVEVEINKQTKGVDKLEGLELGSNVFVVLSNGFKDKDEALLIDVKKPLMPKSKANSRPPKPVVDVLAPAN